MVIIHFLQTIFGFRSNDGNSAAYLFWSGAGSDLTYLSFLGAGYILYKKHNCEVKRCPRIARHDLADPETGIVHHLCRMHHPDHPGRQLRYHEILRIHKSQR